MIDVKMEQGVVKHFEVGGNVFDIAADVTSLCAAIYSALKRDKTDTEDGISCAEVFRTSLAELFTNEELAKFVFDENPYDMTST